MKGRQSSNRKFLAPCCLLLPELDLVSSFFASPWSSIVDVWLITRVLWRVLLTSQGDDGKLTVEGGHRKLDGLAAAGGGSILNLLGGWIVGVMLGGDINGVNVRGMFALLCPGSEMLRLNESFSESRLLSPSLNISD